MNIKELIHNGSAVIDVRSCEEFSGGHANGSINIPLPELPSRLEEVRKLPQPVILCCASGNRSGQAEQFLHTVGINCINGGSWLNINQYKSL